MQKNLTEGKVYKANTEKNSMLNRLPKDDLIGKLDKILEDGESKEIFRPIWTVGEYNQEGNFDLVRLTNFLGQLKYVPNEMVQFRRGNAREKALRHYNNSKFIGNKLYKNKE